MHGEAEILLGHEEAILGEDGRVHARLVGEVRRDGRGRLHVGVGRVAADQARWRGEGRGGVTRIPGLEGRSDGGEADKLRWRRRAVV